MSKLYILRGIPGSGKSTYGKKIVDSAIDAGFSAIKFEADDFFMKDGKYNWNPKLIGMAQHIQTEKALYMKKSSKVHTKRNLNSQKLQKPQS